MRREGINVQEFLDKRVLILDVQISGIFLRCTYIDKALLRNNIKQNFELRMIEKSINSVVPSYLIQKFVHSFLSKIDGEINVLEQKRCKVLLKNYVPLDVLL